jgi:hypothetical protein
MAGDYDAFYSTIGSEFPLVFFFVNFARSRHRSFAAGGVPPAIWHRPLGDSKVTFVAGTDTETDHLEVIL